MNLSAIAIRRPIFIMMINVLIVLSGILSFNRIGLDRLPTVQIPVISIITGLVGGSPTLVDSDITQVIESSVNTISDIDYISSSSLAGVSIVTIHFQLNKDLDVAFNEVQSKINLALPDLPRNSMPPIIQKIDTNAVPILWLVLQGNRSPEYLTSFANNTLKKQLQNVTGVGQVMIGDERKPAIRINLNLHKMANYKIMPQDIVTAFQREHFSLPGGFVTSGNKEKSVNLDMEYHNSNQLQQLIIGYQDKTPIHLNQVAQIQNGLSDTRSLAHFNGKPTVALGIIKVNGANTVNVVNQIKQKLINIIIPALPPGIKIHLALDNSVTILDIIHALIEHLAEGTLFAGLVVWAFLRNFRSTLIVTTAIPISLLGAIASMYVAGFTFNILTLLALLLLIGVVVDDSIVVLENIYRHVEKKGNDESVVLHATQQVMLAVIASTLTIVSIFGPVIFLEGLVGRFFQSFAVIVTVGVLVSLFVSLSLTPMLCSRYLKVVKTHGPIYRFLETGFIHLENFYCHLLKWSLQNRWKLVIFILLLSSTTLLLLGHIGKEFLPRSDDGRFNINFKTPIDSSVAYTEERMNQIEKMVQSHSEVKSLFATMQSNHGIIYVQLSPHDDRVVTQSQLMQIIGNEMAGIPGVEAFPSEESFIGSGRGEPLSFSLIGPDATGIDKYAKLLSAKLSQQKGLGKIDTDLQPTKQQYQLIVNRKHAQDLALDTPTIVSAFSILTSGITVAKLTNTEDNQRSDIFIKAQEGEITKPRDLERILLHNRNNQTVSMDKVTKLISIAKPTAIDRTDMQNSTNFYLSPDISLDSAINIVKNVAAHTLPTGYKIKLFGEAEELIKTERDILFTMLLALALVYMVLASQFNSFIQPLVLILALPFGVMGGLFALWLTGYTLNIYSMIGLILLMGLVAKNSILLIDLTNQLRTQGLKINDALREACPQRMRPVLMTSLTIILALLPAASGHGPGAQTNASLAIAVIGGMISSTLLTLMVIPAVYSLVETAWLFDCN